MKIIKENKDYKVETYTVSCEKCGCVLEYTEKDVSPVFDKLGYIISSYIKCPKCGKIISVV